MVYKGKVVNGVVVFQSSAPPEGTAVHVHAAPQPSASPPEGADPGPVTSEDVNALWDGLMKFAGKATGLPPDLARRHDHYRRERMKR
jgi:hypothetical protein